MKTAKPHTARRPAPPILAVQKANSEPSMVPLTFSRDRHLRKRLFAPESFDHQAKANLHLITWCVEQYTTPGDLLLDPMARLADWFQGEPQATTRVSRFAALTA